MRTAFFGGSFDPPHLGHIAVARAAQQALQLDQVLFAPVGLQPLKPAGSTAPFADRVAMTELAIANQPQFEICSIDAPDPANLAPNYTADTLIRLRATLPAATQIFLLLGADSFRTLPRWHRSTEIPYLANLIVAARPNEDLSNLAAHLPHGVSLTQLATPGARQHVRYLLRNPAGAQSYLYLLPNLNFEISATQLRRQIQGHPTRQAPLLAPPVLNYIREHSLYQ